MSKCTCLHVQLYWDRSTKLKLSMHSAYAYAVSLVVLIKLKLLKLISSIRIQLYSNMHRSCTLEYACIVVRSAYIVLVVQSVCIVFY